MPPVNCLVADALAAGAQLVVFPEAFLGGYPKGVDFGTRVGMRLPGGREFFDCESTYVYLTIHVLDGAARGLRR